VSKEIQEMLMEGFKDGSELALVSCLILSTEIAFEVWLIKPESLVRNVALDIECIYRKQELGVD
jgi:hypothetical protein